jgi:hypothetical protein
MVVRDTNSMVQGLLDITQIIVFTETCNGLYPDSNEFSSHAHSIFPQYPLLVLSSCTYTFISKKVFPQNIFK